MKPGDKVKCVEGEPGQAPEEPSPWAKAFGAFPDLPDAQPQPAAPGQAQEPECNCRKHAPDAEVWSRECTVQPPPTFSTNEREGPMSEHVPGCRCVECWPEANARAEAVEKELGRMTESCDYWKARAEAAEKRLGVQREQIVRQEVARIELVKRAEAAEKERDREIARKDWPLKAWVARAEAAEAKALDHAAEAVGYCRDLEAALARAEAAETHIRAAENAQVLAEDKYLKALASKAELVREVREWATEQGYCDSIVQAILARHESAAPEQIAAIASKPELIRDVPGSVRVKARVRLGSASPLEPNVPHGLASKAELVREVREWLQGFTGPRGLRAILARHEASLDDDT